MAPFVGGDAQNETGGQMYELVGVVVHTGSSANAGHYTAHIRSGMQWWKFDDETVTKLKPSELGEEPEALAETAASKGKGAGTGKSKGKTKGKAKAKARAKSQATAECNATSDGKPRGSVVANADVDDETAATVSGTARNEENEADDHGVRASTNAYMLIYRHRDENADTNTPQDTGSTDDEALRAIPASLLNRVQRENSQAVDEIKDYQARYVAEKARIAKAKIDIENVLKLMEENPVEPVSHRNSNQSRLRARAIARADELKSMFFLDRTPTNALCMEQGKPHRWIPTEYLKQFVTGKVGLGKVDTTALLCDGQHDTENQQGPRPPKLRLAPPAKRISLAAWAEIVKLNGLAGPELKESDCCYDCAINVASARLRELTRIEEDFTGLQLLDEVGDVADDSQNVYMSKEWIKRWKQRSKTKSFASLKKEPWELLMAQRKKPQAKQASESDEVHKEELWKLNCDLQCIHGNLKPDSSQRQEVTHQAWEFFVKQREKTNTTRTRTSPAPRQFPVTDVGCPQCAAEYDERIRKAKTIKTQADEERKDEDLSLIFNMHACDPSTMYRHYIGQKQNPLYVVATAWLGKWRQYIAPGKSKVGTPRQHPGQIDNSLLLCPHRKLM